MAGRKPRGGVVSIQHYVWYEKYRPTVLEQMVFTPEQFTRFDQYITDQDFPHLLFIGPPGSGKTTTAQVLCKALPTQVLELNASSEDRGIDVIRNKVTQFAGSQPKPGFLKVVFLDEADQLTQDAQKALRNTIEKYAATCRFVLTANYGDKILPPIRSRCTVFVFEAFPKESVAALAMDIMYAEGVTFEHENVVRLVDRFYPDIRTIINNAQAGSLNGHFNPKYANVAATLELRKVYELLNTGRITEMRQLWAGVSDFIWLYRWLFDEVVPTMFLDDTIADAALTVAQYMYQDAMVVDREINFTACCLDLMKNCVGVQVRWSN